MPARPPRHQRTVTWGDVRRYRPADAGLTTRAASPPVAVQPGIPQCLIQSSTTCNTGGAGAEFRDRPAPPAALADSAHHPRSRPFRTDSGAVPTAVHRHPTKPGHDCAEQSRICAENPNGHPGIPYTHLGRCDIG